jgi:CBS domain-containing protein
VRVRDVMTKDCPTVDGVASLQSVVDEMIRTGRRCFIVLHGDLLAGLLTPGDLARIPAEERSVTPVRRAMKPLAELRTVRPETPVTEALELMARDNINQLPVTSNGMLVGIFTRAHALQLLQARSELRSS